MLFKVHARITVTILLHNTCKVLGNSLFEQWRLCYAISKAES